jgi:thioredoxin-like negative regulator of GroEL
LNSPITEEPRIIEVWAPHCMECRAMEAALEEVAAEFAGQVRLEKVNAATDLDRARRLGTMATPTLIAVAGGAGSELFRIVGRRSRSELRAAFAAAARGESVGGAGRHDRALRVGSGAALTAIGALTGPAWPLLIAGLGITAWCLASAHGANSA